MSLTWRAGGALKRRGLMLAPAAVCYASRRWVGRRLKRMVAHAKVLAELRCPSAVAHFKAVGVRGLQPVPGTTATLAA
jgi:hypothetical protein